MMVAQGRFHAMDGITKRRIRMNKTFGIATVLAAGFLSGCATRPTFVATETYETPDYLVDVQGTGEVTGTGFMRQRGGGVVSCAGEEVHLLPVTAYTTERINFIYGSPEGGKWIRDINTGTPRDEQYIADTRIAKCHVDGRFTFEDVPAGDYYVATNIVWQVNAYSWEGGAIMRPVTVVADETADMVLNN